jgi:Tfp pilus assembly protein PilF
VSELRRLIREQPDLFDARLRAAALLALAGSPEQAIAEARALIEVANRVPHAERVASRAHRLLADLYVSRGELELAAHSYERALEMPQPGAVRAELAAIYRELGRPDDAARVLGAARGPREEAAGSASPMR